MYADLYETTEDASRLETLEGEWERLVASENLLITGGIPEYFAPGIARDEGCSQADWLRLSLRLWEITGKMRYLEQAERTWFNAFSLNQFPSGDFGHVSFSKHGLDFGGGRAWWCCTLHGLRTFPVVTKAAFRVEGSRIYYDLPVDGTTESAGLRVEAESLLDSTARVHLEVIEAGETRHTVGVRQPGWAEIRPFLNGEAIEGEEAGDYLVIERHWRKGDVLELHYELQTREVADGHRGGGTLFHGPWLVGISEAESKAYFDEPHEHNRVDLGSFRDTDRPSHLKIRYLPAGYSVQSATVVLRPLAERTWGRAGLRWEFRFGDVDAESALGEEARRLAIPVGIGLAGTILGLLAGFLLFRRRG